MEKAIVVVDPFSTGLDVASKVVKTGLKCVRVLSVLNSTISGLVAEGISAEFIATVQHNNELDPAQALDETIQALITLPFKLIAVIPGCETGVALADQLSQSMKLRSNGTRKSSARRNKFIMGETVRNSGLRAAKQTICNDLNELNDFLQLLVWETSDLNNLKCVVKPVQSAGTDNVYLCSTADEARRAFNKIHGTFNGLGIFNDNVLVQEFLEGKEYIVDSISKDGTHKICAVWEYDKRTVNGANFVYFGQKLCSTESPMTKKLIQYAHKVLDALEIRNGPSHMEVIVKTTQNEHMEEYDYCLVEVGARCQGGEGCWITVAEECIGFTQVEATVDVYTNGTLFEFLESDRYTLKKAGRCLDLVCRDSGKILGFPSDPLIRCFPSFRRLAWEWKMGDLAQKTVDCFTRPGHVQLVADSETEVERDYEAIHAIEARGLFDYVDIV